MRVVALVPIKLTNERLPGKNLVPLSSGESMLDRILVTLGAVEAIDDVVVFCSDRSIQAATERHGARFLRRSADLDLPTATSNMILDSFAAEMPADIFVLAHATAPLLRTVTLERGLRAVMSGDYDSALSVVGMHDFLWTNDGPLNYDPSNIPRTQDLEPIYRETSGFYIFKREVLSELGRRVGVRPFLTEVDPIEALDVDEQRDLDLVNAVLLAQNESARH